MRLRRGWGSVGFCAVFHGVVGSGDLVGCVTGVLRAFDLFRRVCTGCMCLDSGC